MLSICNEGCNKKFELKGFKEDKIENDIREIYFTCPHCNKKYICYYTDRSIRQKQSKIRQAKTIDHHNKLEKKIKIEMDNLKRRMLGTK